MNYEIPSAAVVSLLLLSFVRFFSRDFESLIKIFFLFGELGCVIHFCVYLDHSWPHGCVNGFLIASLFPFPFFQYDHELDTSRGDDRKE